MKTQEKATGWRVPAACGILITMGLVACSGTSDGTGPAYAAGRCALTQGSADPDYKPNPPLRSRVGAGFSLTGIVRSGIDCSVIARARVEFWLRGPDGQYDDAHRGAVITDSAGRYRFESNFPGGDGGFQPHIHLRVAVPGYHTLVTVYFPHAGASAGVLDLVLEPEM